MDAKKKKKFKERGHLSVREGLKRPRLKFRGRIGKIWKRPDVWGTPGDGPSGGKEGKREGNQRGSIKGRKPL